MRRQATYTTSCFLEVYVKGLPIKICAEAVVDYRDRIIEHVDIYLENGRKHKAFLKATDAYKLPERIKAFIEKHYEEDIGWALEESL